MGAAQSSPQDLSSALVVMPPMQMSANITSDYALVLQPKSKKNNTSLNLYNDSKTKKTIMTIQKHPRIEINGKLIVAKCSNFLDYRACRDFAGLLKSMIMNNTEKGKKMEISFGDNAYGICRFLKILVTDNDQYFLMPLLFKHLPNSSDWVEDSFTHLFMSDPTFQSVLIEILSMVKRQKLLINKTGGSIFNIEFVLNRRVNIGDKDAFHTDEDRFGGLGNPEYISVTNISQKGYGLTAEIKHERDNKSYSLLASPCDTIVLLNNGANIVHRTPTLQLINQDRYNNPDERRGVATFHQSSLTEKELNSDVIMKLNKGIEYRRDPRDLIAMFITDPTVEDYESNMREVTGLIPKKIYISPKVNYALTAFNRSFGDQDILEAFDSYLKPHSIGGASKKRKRGKTRNKKRRKRHTKKRTQRGGTKFPDFAIYATNEQSAQLIMENVKITETPLPSLTYE